MANVFDYLNEFGDVRFEEKPFNEVDNLIFAELAYLDYARTKINENCHTLGEIGHEYLSKYTYRQIRQLGIEQGVAFRVLEAAYSTERFRHLPVSDYVHLANRDMQFSAMAIRVTRDLEYVAFEGSDQMIGSWREDFAMACTFPVPAHLEAIKYLKGHIHPFGPKVIVGGHSKGGNLALVAAMSLGWLRRSRVKAVYNNDGPGLRRNEFESKEFENILSKYYHIVPHSTVVGALLCNRNYVVVKASKDNILGHSGEYWQVFGDRFERAKRSERSLEMERRVWAWLDKHDDEDRKKVLEAVFGTLEGCNISNTMSIKSFRNIVKLIRQARNVDKESKDLVISLLKETILQR